MATALQTHIPSFDGLRGAAVLAVALFHGFPQVFPGGFVGVDVFFALSGFLITGIITREWARSGRFDFGRFAKRRLLRLGPALALLLLADFGYAIATGGDPIAHLIDAALVLSAAANWTLALGYDRPGLMAHTWSLAAEMQFYVVWPPILLLALKLGGRRAGLIVAVALIAASGFWRAALTLGGATSLRGFEGVDTRIDGLLFGGLLALLHEGQGPARVALRRLGQGRWFAALGLLSIVAFAQWTDRWLYVGGFDAASVCAAVAILGCLSNAPSLWNRVMTWPPFAALGQVSYGLYLWHFPLIWLIAGDPALAPAWRVLLALTVSVVIASFSYLLVERPILARRRGTAVA